jgi:hypothetical protein
MHGVHKIYVIITKYLYYESFKEEKEKKNEIPMALHYWTSVAI